MIINTVKPSKVIHFNMAILAFSLIGFLSACQKGSENPGPALTPKEIILNASVPDLNQSVLVENVDVVQKNITEGQEQSFNEKNYKVKLDKCPYRGEVNKQLNLDPSYKSGMEFLTEWSYYNHDAIIRMKYKDTILQLLTNKIIFERNVISLFNKLMNATDPSKIYNGPYKSEFYFEPRSGFTRELYDIPKEALTDYYNRLNMENKPYWRCKDSGPQTDADSDKTETDLIKYSFMNKSVNAFLSKRTIKRNIMCFEQKRGEGDENIILQEINLGPGELIIYEIFSYEVMNRMGSLCGAETIYEGNTLKFNNKVLESYYTKRLEAPPR